jgi:hypothetical protein
MGLDQSEGPKMHKNASERLFEELFNG